MLSLLTVSIASYGRDGGRLFTFGLEWGYSAKVFDDHKFIFYDDYGSKTADKDYGLCFTSNGYVLADFGFNVTRRSVIALQSGFEGISVHRSAVPVRLKYSFLPNGAYSDGAILTVSGGVCIPVNGSSMKPAASGSAGGGYRLALGRHTSLDFIACARVTFDNPDITDKWTGHTIPPGRVLQNNATYVSINLGAALNF